MVSPYSPWRGLGRAGHEGVGAAHRAALHQGGEGQMLPGQEGGQFALAGLLVRPQPEGLAVLPLGLDLFHHHMLPGRVEQPGQAQGLLPTLGVLCPGQGLAAPGRLAFYTGSIPEAGCRPHGIFSDSSGSLPFSLPGPPPQLPALSKGCFQPESAAALAAEPQPHGRGQSSSSSRSRKGGGGQAGASCQSTFACGPPPQRAYSAGPATNTSSRGAGQPHMGRFF